MMDLQHYCVSLQTGFLPEQPPTRLKGQSFQAYEDLIEQLPDLIKSRQLSEKVNQLPPFRIGDLESENEWRRAYSVLGFLVNAVIWGSASTPSEHIPPVLAIPYLQVSDHHELLPTITYANSALWNWTASSSDADWSDADQLHTLTSFTGTRDEEWFYLSSVTVEAAGIEPFQILMATMDAVESDDYTTAAHLLNTLPEKLERLGVVLDRVWENCDPAIFYHVLRPFLAGGKGMEEVGLPNGIFFDLGKGKEGKWLKVAGGSAAQSSLFAFFDVALGAKHLKTPKVDTKAALSEIRLYMPGPHRRFLEAIEERSRIRQFCTSSSAAPEAVEAYNSALRAIADFRQRHIRIAQRYIIREARGGKPQSSTDTDGKAQGTGGQPLVEFLGQNREETLAGIVRQQ